jgi:Zn-dependent peptidase ImmA (M78 family)
MQRGFKTKSESISAQLRQQLGLHLNAPLCPWSLAEHLSLHVFNIDELGLAQPDTDQLMNAGSSSWSGFTVREAGLTGVVLNSSHSKRRLRSTLMHEVAHIYLKHVGSRVDVLDTGLLLVSDFSPEQEEEADWLAGALLLPREALLLARKARKTVAQICEEFGASEDMCNWRLRMTAVDMQINRRRSKAA